MDGSPPSEGRGVTPATTSVRLENIRSGKEARHKYCMTRGIHSSQVQSHKVGQGLPGAEGNREQGVTVSRVQGLSCAGPRAQETRPCPRPEHRSMAQVFRSPMLCVSIYIPFYVM